MKYQSHYNSTDVLHHMMNYSSENPCSVYKNASFCYTPSRAVTFSEKPIAKSMPCWLPLPVHNQPLAVFRHLSWLGLKKIHVLDLSVFLTKADFPTKLPKVDQETEEAKHAYSISLFHMLYVELQG